MYGVLGVMAVVAGAHLTLMLQDWYGSNFRYRMFDSVIFDQAVRAYSHFRPPRVPLKAVYAGLGPNFVQLGDHFSPIHVFLAPLYWIWDDMRMLSIAQAMMYAVAAALVWRFTRRLLGPAMAYVVSLCFGLSWGLQSAMDFGYHELDWAVPVLAFILERLYAGRHRQATIGVALLLLVKEEMGLVVAVLGLLFLLRGHPRWGAAVSLVGLVWSALAIKVFVPAFGGNSQQYWTYQSLGPGPASAVRFAFTHPWKVIEIAVSTGERQQLLLWLIAVAAGTSLLSPIALVALPSLALRLLSDTESYRSVFFQYNAPLMVILFMAGVDGVARLLRWYTGWQARRAGSDPASAAVELVTPSPARSATGRGLVRVWAAGLIAFAVYGCTTPLLPFSRLADAGAWRQSAYSRAAFTAASKIPRGATVDADDRVGALVSSRTPHLVLLDGRMHGSEYAFFGVGPWLPYPFTDYAQIWRLRQKYLDEGYVEIWRQDNVWLLKRQS